MGLAHGAVVAVGIYAAYERSAPMSIPAKSLQPFILSCYEIGCKPKRLSGISLGWRWGYISRAGKDSFITWRSVIPIKILTDLAMPKPVLKKLVL